MKGWMRRIRGALGMGMTWALGWTPIGALLGAVLGLILNPPAGVMAVVQVNAITFAFLGFAGGTLFSSVMGVAEGRRRFEELRLPRFAALGAGGGLILGGLAVAAGLWGAAGVPMIGLAVVGLSTLLGAGSAAGTLALARQAGDGERLQAGHDPSALMGADRAD